MFDDSMKAIGKGGLTKNSELSYNNSGTAFLKFSLGATKSRKNKDTGEYDKHSHYYNCVIIGRYAEKMVNHLKKGVKVYIVGDLEFSSWEKDGVKHQKLEIKVDEIQIISRPDEDTNNNNTGNNSYQSGNDNSSQGYQQSPPQGNNHYISDNPDDYYQNGANRHTGVYNQKFDRLNNK